MTLQYLGQPAFVETVLSWFLFQMHFEIMEWIKKTFLVAFQSAGNVVQ